LLLLYKLREVVADVVSSAYVNNSAFLILYAVSKAHSLLRDLCNIARSLIDRGKGKDITTTVVVVVLASLLGN
jgi:hypothetical protein